MNKIPLEILKIFLLSKKGIVLSLLLMIVIGFVIRYSLVAKTDFWYDEAFTGTVLREDWRTMFGILIEDKVHPPIYYVLLKVWCIATSYDYTNLRNFSVVFGVMLIPLTYWFGLKLDSDKENGKLISLFAALLVTFSPYCFIYSVEARSYSMLMVIGALSGISFLHSIQVSPYKFNRNWLLTIILVLSSFGVHYLSLIHIALYAVIYMIFVFYNKGMFDSKWFWQKALMYGIVIYVALVAIFSTSFVVSIVSQLKKRMAWIPGSSLIDPIKSIYAFLFGVDRQQTYVPPVLENGFHIAPLNIAFVLFVLITVSLGLYIYKNKLDKTKIYTVIYLTVFSFGGLFLVALTTDLGINMYVERYLSIYGWFLLVLVAFLGVKMMGKYSIFFIVVYLIFVASIKLPVENHKYTDTSKYIENEMGSPKHIYMCGTGLLVIMNNYTPNYADRILLYAPNNYDLFVKSELYSTAGVRKDFSDAVSGDAYLCNERKDDDNREFIKEIDNIFIYKIKYK